MFVSYWKGLPGNCLHNNATHLLLEKDVLDNLKPVFVLFLRFGLSRTSIASCLNAERTSLNPCSVCFCYMLPTNNVFFCFNFQKR